MDVDPFLSALTVVEEGLSNDDEKLAEELQLQEVLVSSSIKPPISPCAVAGAPSDNTPPCEICEQPMPPADVPRRPACPHPVCSICLYPYVDEVLRRHRSIVKCPRAGCDAVLEPELYREIVPPRLFDAWLDAHQGGSRGDNGSAIVRVSRQDGLRKSTTISVEHLHAQDPSKDPTFQISIHGDCSRDTVVELVNTMLDALDASKEAPGDGVEDSKGKQIVVFPDSVTALGQSSGAHVDQAFDCNICMETMPMADGFDVGSCSHKFCRSCVSQYVKAKVEQNATTIGCPDPECREGTLDPEMCREILPESVFNRWGVALCESAIGAAKFYCPYKDCSALLINDNGDGDGDGAAMMDAECPHCHRMLCAQCKVPWHGWIDCEGFQQLDEDERGREDLMLRKLATDSKWQRCPNCRMYVEKIDGCMYMSCRCGHGFCYICATPMSKDYHYCAKCLR